MALATRRIVPTPPPGPHAPGLHTVGPRAPGDGWRRDPVTGVLRPEPQDAMVQARVAEAQSPDRPAAVVLVAPLVGLVLWALIAALIL